MIKMRWVAQACLLIVLSMLLLACGEGETPVPPTVTPTSTNSRLLINTGIPTQTARLTATRGPSSTPRPTWTPTQYYTKTPYPTLPLLYGTLESGIQEVYLVYTELPVSFNTSLWSAGPDPDYQCLLLTHTKYEDCTIREQGPTEFPAGEPQSIKLGTVNYLLIRKDEYSWAYISDYHFYKRTEWGLVYFVVELPGENTQQCLMDVEKVLSTLSGLRPIDE